MDEDTYAWLSPLSLIAVLLFTFLLNQRWFWVLALSFGGLGSCFAMVASLIQFQILGAVAYFILMSICWGLADLISG